MNIRAESNYSEDFKLMLQKIYGGVIDELVFFHGSFENIEELRAAVGQAILDCVATGQSDPAQIVRCAIACVKTRIRTDYALRPAHLEQAVYETRSRHGR